VEDTVAVPYERTVVSERKHAVRTGSSTASITTLSRFDLERRGARTIPEALAQALGVQLIPLTPKEPALGLRAFNQAMSNRVLVMVDGEPITWEAWGTPIWSALPISLHDVESIEVVRGPVSALHGANALTGAINIRTTRESRVHSGLVLTAGSDGLLEESARLALRTGDTSWVVSGGSSGQSHRARLSAATPRGQTQIRSTLDFVGGETAFVPWGSMGRHQMPFNQGSLRFAIQTGDLILTSSARHIRASGPYPEDEAGRPLDTTLSSNDLRLGAEWGHTATWIPWKPAWTWVPEATPTTPSGATWAMRGSTRSGSTDGPSSPLAMPVGSSWQPSGQTPFPTWT